jgi:hypothetical protein
LNALNSNEGDEKEKNKTSYGRQIRNCIDLLQFACERDDLEQIEFYSEKLSRFGKIRPLLWRSLYDQLQFAKPRKYMQIFIEIMKKWDTKFMIANNCKSALESLPIFFVAVACDIEQYQPDLLDEFKDLGNYRMLI